LTCKLKKIEIKFFFPNVIADENFPDKQCMPKQYNENKKDKTSFKLPLMTEVKVNKVSGYESEREIDSDYPLKTEQDVFESLQVLTLGEEQPLAYDAAQQDYDDLLVSTTYTKPIGGTEEELRQAIALLHPRITHLSLNHLTRLLVVATEELFDAIGMESWAAVLPPRAERKSNTWVFDRLRNAGAFDKNPPFTAIEQVFREHRLPSEDDAFLSIRYFVFFDDMIFSGTQMSQFLEDFVRCYTVQENAQLHIVTGAATRKAVNRITNKFGRATIHTGLVLKPMRDLLNAKQLKLVKKFFPVSVRNDGYLVYTDIKLADFFSAELQILSRFIGGKCRNVYQGAKPLNKSEMSEPPCPFPPYKSPPNKTIVI